MLFLQVWTLLAAPTDLCATQSGIQCYGDDIKDAGPLDSAEACCDACRATSGCAAWTWNAEIDQHCWVKRGCSDQRQAKSYISGTSPPPSPSPVPPSPAYHRVLNINSSSFMDTVQFFTEADPTHGSVNFISASEALADGLVRFNNGQIFMSADLKSEGTPRRSVRVFSKATFTKGVMVINLEHMPTGCGTWPAFWMCGPGWPSAGEIDILEGVNLQTHDQTTLHTSQGCSMAKVDPASFTGSWGKGSAGQAATDCYVQASGQYGNQGCPIINPSPSSYGSPFNDHKGGVIATVWDDAGIRSYSWPAGSLPPDVAARLAPNEKSWGLPYARFDFGGECDASHFHDHQLIFDLTLCGDWAGAAFSQQCSGKAANCDVYIADAANVQEAYWLVNHVDVWSAAGGGVGSSHGLYQGPERRSRSGFSMARSVS